MTAKMVTSCFKQKSSLVKCLIVLLIALIIILVALFVNLVVRKDNHTCNSKHCIEASVELIKYVDPSISPCDDFYSFACGNFLKNFKELPPPEPNEELDSIITDPVQFNDSKALHTEKLFYQACTNLGNIEIDQDQTVVDLFYALGDWPVLRGSNWDGTHFEWTDVVKKSRRMGMKFDWFLNFSIFEDTNNTQLNILKIDVPISLKRIDPEEKRVRKDLLTDIAELMGAPKYLAHYETAKTVEFEDELGTLAENHRQREEEWDVSSLPKLTINEIQTLWPSIQWLELINTVTENSMVESDLIVFNILDYVKDLNKLILGTPKRIVADYMMWKILEGSWPYLTQPIREKFERYNEMVYQQDPELNRQKFCLNESKKQFPLIAESVYIRRHVTEQKRQLVREMLFLIQRRYMKLLESAAWMNREHRKNALRKLQDIKFLIGGPQEVFDQFRFAEDLGVYGFGFKSSNIIEMLNERRDRYYKKYFSVLNRRLANNTVRYFEKAINITTFTVVNHNTIVMPAALLRDTFYNPNLPNYLNYGTLGKVLAQEIFDHIFSRNHSSFIDYESNDYNNHGLKDLFEQSVKCLIKESSIYIHNPDPEEKRNKIRRHLADYVATQVAYDSYKKWLENLPQELPLPALKYTPYQTFWIQSSKDLCRQMYTKQQREDSRFKIEGPVRNSRDFARDFNCQEGSKMNSRRKCQVL